MTSFDPNDLYLMIQNDWYTIPSYLHFKLGYPMQYCPVPESMRRILTMIVDLVFGQLKKKARKNPAKVHEVLTVDRVLEEMAKDEDLRPWYEILSQNRDWFSIDLALTKHYLLGTWDATDYIEYYMFCTRYGITWLSFPDFLVYCKGKILS